MPRALAEVSAVWRIVWIVPASAHGGLIGQGSTQAITCVLSVHAGWGPVAFVSLAREFGRYFCLVWLNIPEPVSSRLRYPVNLALPI